MCEMNPLPSYIVLFTVNGHVRECVTYFPDELEEAFLSIGVPVRVLSSLILEQAI